MTVKMWCLLAFITFLQCVNTVRIFNVRVPEVLQYGTRDAVTLDCDYSTNNVTGLVVKWFYMDRSHPVYQWIPPQKPQALGILKNKVTRSFIQGITKSIHTAPRVTHPLPGTELTGNYTCVVSTFLSEDERTRSMTIFAPETKFDMIQDRLSDGYLNIICSVEGVFPRPELVILVGNRLISAKSTVRIVDERYTALTSALVEIDSLPPTVEVMCDMEVPLANYYSRKRGLFYRDPPPSTANTIVNAYSGYNGNLKKSTLELLAACIIIHKYAMSYVIFDIF